MNSLSKAQDSYSFRLSTKIITQTTLQECFSHLALQNGDLILTNGFLIPKITAATNLNEVDIIDLDVYGRGEPKASWVDEVIKKANAKAYQRIIGIGGGSTIDIAKLCVFGDGRDARRLFEEKTELKKQRKLVILPTTCGTGSEVTSVSVMEFDDIQSKLGLQLDALFPDQAILVSEVLESLPYKTYAISSIDALAHAIESLLSPKANAYTDMFARSAIEGILKNFLTVRGKKCLPSDLEHSLVCANMAGIAFSIAGCATMHALSFPLGSNYHLAHGEAVYAVFGSVLEDDRKRGISLEKLETIVTPYFPEATDVIDAMMSLLQDIQEKPNFKALGITESVCELMAESVYEHQQRLLVNAPKPLSRYDLASIYKHCLNGGQL